MTINGYRPLNVKEVDIVKRLNELGIIRLGFEDYGFVRHVYACIRRGETFFVPENGSDKLDTIAGRYLET